MAGSLRNVTYCRPRRLIEYFRTHRARSSLASGMTSVFAGQIDEIARDRALRIYGIALALTHALTWSFWSRGGVMLGYVIDRTARPPLCWPFFPGCSSVQIPYVPMAAASCAYLIASLAVAHWFSTKQVVRAWWGLFGLVVTKWAMLALDYRGMGNYHYMTFLVALAYLFVPGKRAICRLLIVAFYVAAGSLKLNTEWLSGQAIFVRPWVSGVVLEWLCIGAVLIELIAVWGLLSSDRVWRYGAMTTLLVFHLFSYHIVGYFYPATMLLLLSLFPLSWHTEPAEFRLRPVHALVLAAFVICQLIPRLQDGDPALVSRGRLYALDMFDAYARCESTLVVKYANESYEVPAETADLAARIACDPIVYWNLGRRLCRENKDRAGFRDVDILLTARRASVEASTTVMAVRDFCARAPAYNTLFANAWVSP